MSSVAAQVARSAQLVIDVANTAAKSLMTPVYNVQGYGANGTAAKDMQAFNSALAAAIAAGGGRIVYPPGEWFIDSAAVNSECIIIEGAGLSATTLRVVNTSGYGLTFGDGVTTRYQCGLRNLTIVHAGTPTSGALVRFNKVGQSVVDNVKVMGWNPGFVGLQFDSCLQMFMNAVEVQSQLSDGVVMNAPNDLYWVNCRSDGNAGHGFYIEDCNGVYMVNCSAWSNDRSGFVLAGQPAQLGENAFFVQCVGDTSGSFNWAIDNAVGVFLNNCWAVTNKAGAPSYVSGFFVGQYATEVQFSNCKAKNNQKHGFEVYGNQVALTGCAANSNGVGSAGSAGFYFANNTKTSITGCHAYDMNGVATQAYGIVTSGTANDYIITGNLLKGNLAASLNEQATGLSKVVANNLV